MRDQTIAQLRDVISSAANLIQSALDVLGVQRSEEQKEEHEDKLFRLVRQILSLSNSGSVAYNDQKNEAQAAGCGKNDDKSIFMTFSKGGSLNNSILNFDLAEGFKRFETPNIDMKNWYSCQLDALTIFQCMNNSTLCRSLKMFDQGEFIQRQLKNMPNSVRNFTLSRTSPEHVF